MVSVVDEVLSGVERVDDVRQMVAALAVVNGLHGPAVRNVRVVDVDFALLSMR